VETMLAVHGTAPWIIIAGPSPPRCQRRIPVDRIEKAIKMLDSPKASARYDACEWLRVAPSLSDAAISALEKALTDADPEVRVAAHRALNVHRAAPPQPEITIRERAAICLKCSCDEVVQTLPKVCLYCGKPATRVKRQIL